MTTLGAVLLATSLLSLTVYAVSLARLLSRPRREGLVRTAVCRVTAAVLYTAIALATLSGHKNSGVISVSVFVAIQLMWQANSVADVLLAPQQKDDCVTRQRETVRK